VPESMSTSEEQLFADLVAHFDRMVTDSMAEQIHRSLTAVSGYIDLFRTALTAEGAVREEVWAGLCVSLTQFIAESAVNALVSHDDEEIDIGDLVGAVIDFAAAHASLVLAVAESGIDILQYSGGKATTTPGGEPDVD
jgi:hypothetical protein